MESEEGARGGPGEVRTGLQGRRPTIGDVARLAGVSPAIASRALASGPRPVSPEKRARVLDAARALDYRPNLLARSLTTRSVNLVAVVVNHIHDLSDLDVFDLLIERIQGLGKQVIVVRVGSVKRVEEFLRDGVATHVDAALVFSDFADAETVRTLFRSDRVVMMNGLHDARSPAVIGGDQGIVAAIDEAAAKGVRRAVLVTGRQSSLVERERILAYRRAMARHGMRLVDEITGDYSYASGHTAAPRIRAAEPDAVFCTSDAMAMGLLDACRELFPNGRPDAVQPGAFRLYGFDDISLTAFDAYPISSIGYDKAEYVEAMLGLLAAPAGAPSVVVPTRFVARLTG